MGKLVYDGHGHTIELFGSDGKSRGKWTAYNNIDSAFAKSHYHSLTHLKDGSYNVTDTRKPHAHVVDPNGPYGSHGIIRFAYPDHPGVGLHSGRADAKNMPGPQHATHGCIRTTDAAMKHISDAMKHESINRIEIRGNSHVSVKHGAAKHVHLNHH